MAPGVSVIHQVCLIQRVTNVETRLCLHPFQNGWQIIITLIIKDCDVKQAAASVFLQSAEVITAGVTIGLAVLGGDIGYVKL
jgi:hypothetical protein